MTIQSKKEYLAMMRQRYLSCQTRHQKTNLLTEMVNSLDINRKSLIRSLAKKPLVNRKVIPGRKEVYGFDLIYPLTTIWKVAGKPCSKRLKPQIGEIIDRLKVFGEIKFYSNQEKLIRQASTFTLDRLLAEPKGNHLKDYGLSGTKRSPLLKTLIPIRTNFEEVKESGHIEADCVLHCGDSLKGQYAETLNLLDIHSHWNEKTIFFKKTKTKVIGAIHRLRDQFPFLVQSLDFDNGHEFINWQLHAYCQREQIKFTRCRAYHKNDQAHIEAKNYQSIRRLIGYERIDNLEVISLIDDLYQNEHRLLTNFFYTTMKLKSKVKKGGKYSKTYEIAKTPYQRLIESDTISMVVKKRLKQKYLSLNPARLQKNLEKKLAKIQTLLG